MAPLNIVYLHSHDTGRYIEPYGHAVPTPNLRRLAEQGVLFRRAFSAAPTCSPSRSAMLTGQYPHQCGMIGLVNRGCLLTDDRRHLANVLSRAGYHTALFGIQHEAADPAAIGYAQSWMESVFAAEVGPKAAEFLTRGPREPFFLSVGFVETHRDFPPFAPGEERYVLPPAGIADTPETRRDMAGFCASARAMDAAVGVVLEALDRAGLRERTLVMYAPDHGVAFPRHKSSLYDGGIGVSLILRGPGGLGGGRVIDAMVSHMDVFPTICDLTGVSRPPWLEGRSIMPLLRGEVEAIRDELFAEITYHCAYDPQRAVRTARWKYIRRFADEPRVVLCHLDDSPSKELWICSGGAERRPAREELYDLTLDVDEQNNRGDDATCVDVLNEMRGRLERWMRRTDDPLLRGPVPPRPGFRLNQPQDRSPGDPAVTIT